MNMTEKNGQPSMEEILASIRRIIAEEPGEQHNGELGGTPILLRGDGVLDDAGDFDLPAIFRASPPQTDRHTPLLGRLTDAIRNATAAQPEAPVAAYSEAEAHEALSSLTVRSGEYVNGHVNGHANGHVNGHGHANGHVNGSAHVNGNGHVNGSGYTNGSAYAHERAPVMQDPAAAAAAVLSASSSSDEPQPKRVMAAFKDTHFMRMTNPVIAPVAPAPAPAPAVEVMPPVYVAPPVQVEAPVVAAPVIIAPVMPTPVETPHFAPSEPAAFEAAPPPLPASASPAVVGAPASGGMEDATADLLRPMLRQWLADNMPRMVEKALHIEIAESVKTPKKP